MDSTIGEYATSEIKRVIALLTSGKELSKRETEECDYIIRRIGEPMIQNRLEGMYRNATNRNLPTRHRNEIKNGEKLNEYEEIFSKVTRQIKELQNIQKSLERLKND